MTMKFNKDRNWLAKRAEQEDRHFISVGNNDAITIMLQNNTATNNLTVVSCSLVLVRIK